MSILPFLKSFFYSILVTYYRIVFLFSYFFPKKTIQEKNPEKEYYNPVLEKFQTYILENGENDKNTNIDPIFYEKKDFNDFMKTENNSLETIWKTRILMEFSPRGNIIMYYDAYKMGFAYYCDQNVVSYDILNVVAMKYVMTFRCYSFFIDESLLPDSYKNLLKIHYLEDKKEKQEKKDKEEKQESRDNIKNSDSFVKLKNYKTGESKEKPEEKMKNKFIYLGNIRNFNISQPIPKKRTMNHFHSKLLDGLSSTQTFSYNDFKRLKEKN